MSMVSCPGCSSPVPAHVQFCTSCGIRIGDAPSDPASTPPIQPAASFSAPPRATANPAVEELTPPTFDTNDARLPRRRWTQRRLIVLGIALGLIIGVGGRLAWALTHRAPDQGELVAQLPIDPDGGEATFDNGAGKMKVARGAVSQPQTINIYKRVLDQPVSAVPPSGGAPLRFPPGTLVTYGFGPITIILNRPVEITLPIPQGQQGLVFVTSTGQIRFIPGVGRGQSVTIALSSFDLNRPGAIVVRQ